MNHESMNSDNSSNSGPNIWKETMKDVKFAGEITPEPELGEEVTDLTEIHESEMYLLEKYPDSAGYNIDSKYIIDPERYAECLEAEGILDSGDEAAIAGLVTKYGVPVEKIRQAISEEMVKNSNLDEALKHLSKTKVLRITPHAPNSPFSVAQSRQADGSISISSLVMKQIKKIKDTAKDAELILVMNQIDRDKNGNLTSNIPKDATDYIRLCEDFIAQSGFGEQGGKGLVLEIGNECNMSHAGHEKNPKSQFNSTAFADVTDPEAYANFYYQTAVALKNNHPDLKLSLTGTAFYDYDFTETVVRKIMERAAQDGLPENTKLIDIISFHPYRNIVEGPAPFKANGQEIPKEEITRRANEYWKSLSEETRTEKRDQVMNNIPPEHIEMVNSMTDEEKEQAIIERTYMSYEQQYNTMKKLADSIGATLMVGECSFYKKTWGKSINEKEQARNLQDSAEKGCYSLIWPGEQIKEFEDPDRPR